MWHSVGSYVALVTIYEVLRARIPSVTVGTNVYSILKDRIAMQEMLNTEVFRNVTKYCSRVERPSKIPETVFRAFQNALLP